MYKCEFPGTKTKLSIYISCDTRGQMPVYISVYILLMTIIRHVDTTTYCYYPSVILNVIILFLSSELLLNKLLFELSRMSHFKCCVRVPSE